MDLPKFIRLVADIIDAIEETKSSPTPPAQTEILVCMHCQHILRINGEQCNISVFVPRQVLDPISMQTYHTLWKYRCGRCDRWGFEFDIDEVAPSTDTTN